jgi:hypothetical protein
LTTIGESVAGGVLSILHGALLEASPPELSSLIGSLMSMIVLPYLGWEEAAAELKRPAPELPPRPASFLDGKLNQLQSRVTYRTVLVLSFIARNPGANNRQIAKGSGVEDPGQISRMLSRMARDGLVENTSPGEVGGEANAWQLTAASDAVDWAGMVG